MKKLIFIFSILLCSVNLFGQRLEDKETSNLDDNTLFAVQDSTNKYNWRSVDFATLKSAFNPLRQSDGSIATSSSDIKFSNDIYLPTDFYVDYLKVENRNFGGYTENGVGFDAFRMKNLNANSTPYFQLNSTDGNGVAYTYKSATSISFAPNRISSILPLRNDDIAFNRKQGLLIDVTADRAGNIAGQAIMTLSAGSNGKRSEMIFMSNGTSSPSIFITNSNTDGDTYEDVKADSRVAFYKDSTQVKNLLIADSGIKIAELSYVPSSSTDLQAEALSAKLGTSWDLYDNGTWYRIKKVEISGVTKIVRAAYAEF